MILFRPFEVESDAVWWGRLAREAISAGLDRPAGWSVEHDAGEDGCMPPGWYVSGLTSDGFPIDWPVRHEYGPFRSELEALEHARKVDASYKVPASG